MVNRILLTLTFLVTTLLAAVLQSPGISLHTRDASNPLNIRATCETITYSFSTDTLVYCFPQTNCYDNWVLQKMFSEKEFNAHPSEKSAYCHDTKFDVKSCWYPNTKHKDLVCKMFDLPSCKGNMIKLPYSVKETNYVMKDFSRVPPGWNGRIKSMSYYRKK